VIRIPPITPGRLCALLLLGALCIPALWAITITVSPADATGKAPLPVRDKNKPAPVTILLIGDSLSFGPFGKQLETRFRKRLGDSEMALYASCGSSPENWLSATPVFVTKCGYREALPGESPMLVDAMNGKPCPPWKTPKLPSILKRWAPSIIIVQQGTNWMDNMPDPVGSDGHKSHQIVRKFISELRTGDPSRQIIWILPPDSSKYPIATKQAVDTWIEQALRESGCPSPIRSRTLTAPYRKGITGTDGVHYTKEAAESWANKVYLRILNLLFPEGPGLPQPRALLSPEPSTNPLPR